MQHKPLTDTHLNVFTDAHNIGVGGGRCRGIGGADED